MAARVRRSPITHRPVVCCARTVAEWSDLVLRQGTSSAARTTRLPVWTTSSGPAGRAMVPQRPAHGACPRCAAHAWCRAQRRLLLGGGKGASRAPRNGCPPQWPASAPPKAPKHDRCPATHTLAMPGTGERQDGGALGHVSDLHHHPPPRPTTARDCSGAAPSSLCAACCVPCVLLCARRVQKRICVLCT